MTRPRPGARPLAAALALVAGAGCTRVDDAAGELRPPDAPSRVVTPEQVARQVIDGGDIRRYVGFLASDELRGRATPSRGLMRAGSWVAERFQLAGLEPAGDDGGYVQYRPVPGDTLPALNVLGVLPGGDLTKAGEYVVLVAHLDHLGVGEPSEAGDSIYDGADDNASGVAALAEIADAFAALPHRSDRPVLLVAVSGSERGLTGSRHLLESRELDLSRAVGVLNLDMLGGNPPDRVLVEGREGGGLADRLEAVARATPELALHVSREPVPASRPDGAADHTVFAAAGIPAITVSTGRQEQYHRPDDEPDRVDAEKAARVARLVFLTAHELANER